MIWFITCFAVVLALFGGWSWLIAPQMDKKPDFTALSGFDYAHRGLHKLPDGVPENCLTGFKLAEESGYGMEFDLQLTKDKKVVVHHDATLLRSCGDDVAIADLTYAELRRYRLFGTDEHIPLFSEVLGILKGQTPLIIELKSYNDPAELCELAMEVLEGYKGHYCVESFDPRIVAWFRRNRPDIVRGQLMCRYKKGDEGLGAFEAFCATHMLTNFHTRPNFEAYDIQTRDIPSMGLSKGLMGMQEVSWTVRTEEEYQRAKALKSLVIFEEIRP